MSSRKRRKMRMIEVLVKFILFLLIYITFNLIL